MKSIEKFLIIAALMAPMALAQKKATAAKAPAGPVHVNRIPPPKVDPSQDSAQGEALETPNQRRRRLAAEGTAAPSPDQYPFTEALGALQEVAPNPATKRLTWSSPPQTSVKKAQAPKDYRANTSVPPSETASDAVALSDQWQNARNSPAEGNDGRVVYSDGGGLATVVCAPLRLCIVELQVGEKLTGEPQIGDSVRWNIEPASYGSGEATTPMIVIKPKAVGLDTNLVVTTDRRAYYLRLISSPKEYVAKVSFDYPDDARAKWLTTLRKQELEVREAQFAKSPKICADGAEALNDDYRVKGDKRIRPIRVVDDGVHTCIEMNPAVLRREAPVLAVIGPDRKPEMVNYRVQGSMYVVDRLFDRGRLILGVGRKALKADITRGSTKGRQLFAGDPFRDLTNAGKQENKPQ